ncbi:MAG TPA: M56 and DUF3738 domain-containing protein [Bryobacteraceae bacterium]|nr:M56 and DUF3738 domain-containing protein [Bryobacteraceae bacterium]
MTLPTYLMPLANHLWQSSVFAVAAGVLCWAMRKDRASVRYWLWLAVSVKFLVPFSLLVSLGGLVDSPAFPVIAANRVPSMAREIGQPFALRAPAPLLAAVPTAPSQLPTVLMALWFCGFAASAGGWLRAWLRMRSAVRGASPIRADLGFGGQPVRWMASPALVEPCVFGILRPVLLLPEGIRQRLTPDQLETICAHEICHVRRRDNLTAAVHLLVEAIFWFYPLAYWIGRRLMDEREKACDEGVLRMLANPEAYAQGILAVCRFGLQPSPVCASGVAGSDLRKRIEGIMGYRAMGRLGLVRKLLLAAAAAAALGGPLLTGALFVRSIRAQSQSLAGGAPAFGVASIKPNRTGARNSGFRRFTGGQLDATNIPLRMLIAFAYDIPQDRVLQGPGWLDSERYDILAKPDAGSGQAVDRSMGAIRLRTQALLADRFKLALHKETRQLPIFRLVVDSGGPKHLQPPKGNTPDLFTNGHHVTCQAASMEFFAKVFLTGQMGGPVLDETGIQGKFDFSMDWTPDDNPPARPGDPGEVGSAPDPAGPTLMRALREQLGLKLVPGKGPVEVLIVDRADKASEN